MAGGFNLNTRKIVQRLSTIPYSEGTTRVLDLPQSHLLAAIDLKFRGTISAATANSVALTNGYAASFGPSPLGIARRIRLKTNQGLNLCDATAWALALHNKTERTGFDPLRDPGNFAHTGESAAGSLFNRYFLPITAPTAGNSANFGFTVRIPVAFGPNYTGLQNLQNPSVRYTLEIDWGAPSDILTAGGGGGTIAITDATGLTCTPQLVLFSIPTDKQDMPALGYSRLVQEDRQTIAANGELTYRPVLGPQYLKVLQEFINNSEPIPPANITAIKTRYAQAQEFFNADPDIHLFNQYHDYGQELPEGVYVHDYTLANKLPELPGSRDIVDTSRITDLEIRTTTDATITGTAFIRTIRDMLTPSV